MVFGNPGERVGHCLFFDDGAVAADLQLVVADAHGFARGQANHRVARPALAAFNGFEQVGVGRVCEAVVKGNRGEQVGEDGADDGLVGVVHAPALAISPRMVLMTAA